MVRAVRVYVKRVVCSVKEETGAASVKMPAPVRIKLDKSVGRLFFDDPFDAEAADVIGALL